MKSLISLLVSGLLLAGCASPPPAATPEPEQEKQKLVKSGKTDEVRDASSEQVWSELGCARRQLPYVIAEKSAVEPSQVRAGQATHVRITYAACLPKSTSALMGTLRTRVRMNEETVQDRTEQNYAIKAGRWALDTKINVPESAKSGLYKVELEFKNESTSFSRSQQFRVGPVPTQKKKQQSRPAAPTSAKDKR